MKRIVIFASGSGTNAENIIKHFKNNQEIIVTSVFCNKPDAGVIKRAQDLQIPVVVFNKDLFYNSEVVVDELKKLKTDYIILAGFLWLIPENILRTYNNKIINIHPSLLPNYGGKGMYGMKVHEAVIANNETESGITIHLVNEKYDEGKVIFQASCDVTKKDTPESLAQKIHKLEYAHFPSIIEIFILDDTMKNL